MKVIKAPEKYNPSYREKSIFLAGSIEQGKAINWQAKVEELLKDTQAVIYNPRRNDWDSSWEQSIDNPQFNEQVTWEMDYLQKVTFIIFNFIGDTLSPISLLELGMIGKSRPKKCIVVCPNNFWRKGNVDIFCKRFNIKQVDSLEEAVNITKRLIPKQ